MKGETFKGRTEYSGGRGKGRGGFRGRGRNGNRGRGQFGEPIKYVQELHSMQILQ